MTTALLIIDVQKDILAGMGAPERVPLIAAQLDAVTGRLAALQQKARAAKAPVIIVQHDDKGDHRLSRGAPGWELRPEIAPQAGEPVVHKSACDSFFETDLDQQLKIRGITHLVIGGCMTQYCVDTTARRAVTMGYDVTLVADGHATADAGDFTFEQIVAHHNRLLNGFDAGEKAISVKKAEAIAFPG